MSTKIVKLSFIISLINILSCSKNDKMGNTTLLYEEVSSRYEHLIESNGFYGLNIKNDWIDLKYFDSTTLNLMDQLKDKEITTSQAKDSFCSLIGEIKEHTCRVSFEDDLSSIKIIEKMLFAKLLLYDEFLLKSSSKYHITDMKPVIDSEKKVVKIGEEFIGRISLSAWNSLYNYRVFIKGEDTNHLLEFNNGESFYRSTYSSSGLKKFSGYILVDNNLGNVDTFRFNHQYMVRDR